MPEVFVNYRTGDGEQLATIIDQDLRRRFGDAAVFKDHRSIQAGVVFQKALENGVWGSKVLLCVIGPAWLTAADGTGRRKIDNPEDWIHRELVMAFDHGARVIPVIDERAQPPLLRPKSCPSGSSGWRICSTRFTTTGILTLCWTGSLRMCSIPYLGSKILLSL